ncbi:Transcription factor, MADS-box [Dillenia turbinata]|uniref:Transcription factor, MADS-box n=1 Tax=Dillenia turbinata TaxID=194707 RepID=A0AAN8UVA2_9MAGN
MIRDHPRGSILLGATSHGKLSSVVMEGRKNPEKLPMCHPISYLVPPNKTDLSKSKKVKLPKNSKGRYLAMQRRKKNLFKKASELSTLCRIDVCIIVYDDQNPKTTVETWPHTCNDVLRMVKLILNISNGHTRATIRSIFIGLFTSHIVKVKT